MNVIVVESGVDDRLRDRLATGAAHLALLGADAGEPAAGHGNLLAAVVAVDPGH